MACYGFQDTLYKVDMIYSTVQIGNVNLQMYKNYIS